MRIASRRSLKTLALLVGALGVAMCVDGTTGPNGPSIRASFAFAPIYEPSAHAAVRALADEGLPLDRVRIVLVRPAHDTLKDTTVTMHEGDPALTLELTVAAAPNENLDATMQFKSGETVLFEGTTSVTAVGVGVTGTSTPVEIVITYVGPGATATKVAVTPPTGVYPASGIIQFIATATDDAGTAFPNTPFTWTVNDATLGVISTDGLFTPSGKGGTLVVTATTPKGLSGTASATLALQPASIATVSGDNQSAAVTQQVAQPLIVQVRSADGTGVPGQTVTFAATDGGAVNPATAVTGPTGQAQTTLKVGTRIGAYNFTATAAGFTVNAKASGTLGAAKKMVAVGPAAFTLTSGSVAGASSVKIVDDGDNPVPNVSATIDITIGASSTSLAANSDAAGAIALPAVFANAKVGVYTVTISNAALTGSPITFTVTVVAGAAAKLGVVTQPQAAVTSGVVWSPQPTVRIQDVNGNSVAQSGTVVTVALTTGSGNLNGTKTATTDATGLATFTDLSITGTPGSRTITFSATGLTAVTAATTVTIGAPTKLKVVTSPSGTVGSGVVFGQQPSIQLLDVNDQSVPQAGVVITASVGGATLNGTVTATTDATGLGSFTNLSISGVPGSQSLTFSASGLTSVAAPVTLVVGPPKSLTVMNTAVTAVIGTPITSPQAIRVADDAGNVIPGVTVHFHVGTGSGTPLDQDVVTNASGIATPVWTLATVGANTMTAQIAGTAITNNPATITATGTAPPPTQIAIITAIPSTVRDRIGFAAPLQVQVRDANNQPVSTAGHVITIHVQGLDGRTDSLFAGPKTATTDGSGIATFPGITLAGNAGLTGIEFTSTEFGDVGGTTTLIGGLSAAILSVNGNGQQGSAGMAVETPPRVRVVDVDGNGVRDIPIVFTVTGGSGHVPTPQVLTDTGGYATTSWTLGAFVGPNVLTATAMDTVSNPVGFIGFPGAQTLHTATFAGNPVAFNATGVVGPAAHLVKLYQVDTLYGGAGSDYTVSLKVTDAFGNVAPNVPVTLTIDSTSGLSIGNLIDYTGPVTTPLTITSDSFGAVYVDWAMGGTEGFNQLIASAAGVPSLTFRTYAPASARPPLGQLSRVVKPITLPNKPPPR